MYAVEASNMSTHCSKLVKANNFSDRMIVITGKIEEVCFDDVIMMSYVLLDVNACKFANFR